MSLKMRFGKSYSPARFRGFVELSNLDFPNLFTQAQRTRGLFTVSACFTLHVN